MRDLAAEDLAALQARSLVARDFVWFVARTRDTGEPVTDGYWSDVGPINAEVIDPLTGLVQEREFFGSYGLIQISDIPLVSNLQVQVVSVVLSQLDDRAQNLVRTYDCKQARVEIFRGLFNPATRKMVAPARSRFLGYVDDIEIVTPSEGEVGQATLHCKSNTQELARSNPDTRSDASQKRRSATDNFYQDVGVVGEWEIFWGVQSGKLTKSTTGA